MRELGKQETGAIAGGHSVSTRPTSSYHHSGNPANPLTVTFGTPVEPGLVLPEILPNWFFGH